jgi:geranylgeranyl diphosphate synthase type I
MARGSGIYPIMSKKARGRLYEEGPFPHTDKRIFFMTLAHFRQQFDPILLDTLKAYQSRLPVVESSLLTELLQYPERLFQGGKRVRPYLASLLYTNLGGELSDETQRFFAALEFLHVFCLIHDDIIDEGETRHHIPTLHRYTAERLHAEGRQGNGKHLGNAQAMLIGDLIFSWSIDLARRGPGSPRVRLRSQELFFQMIDEVVIGQLIDVDLSTRTTATLTEIEQKMRLKTAGYTFVKPLEIGASLHSNALRIKHFCEGFGGALGLAFQWQDDLLDLTSDISQTKKTCFSDLLTRQQTPYTHHIRTHGSRDDQMLLDTFLGKPLTESEQIEARALFERTGALQAGRETIERLFAEAEKLLTRASFLQRPEEFSDLIALLRVRVS